MSTFKRVLFLPLKGIIAILTIQVIVFVVALTFQSCKKSHFSGDRELQKQEVNTLNALLKAKTSNFIALNENRKRSETSRPSSMETMSTAGRDPNFVITPEYELQCEVEVRPVYNQSLSVISAYGITEQDMVEEWGYNYDQELVVELALSIAAYEALDHEHGLAQVKQSLFLFNTAYAGDFYNCVKTALGIEALFELWRVRALSTYAGKKMLLKAIGKVATRSLGWVGAAWAVADFIDCYY
ncbi:hypothetical protein [Hydrotalea sandarakina]|jgi:hypothetical protein|uniref:Uncharacterized protein n=1 Tax=Hydrotalea sandarakina TaxID=1004304 RepID=A0A2W7RXX6_9BACT|nr:hypothetical protein [Hydrotalea sandarakina]PZX59449.1 hypothetical protein LX80_02815 [Hydrotalea sandarakina]